MPAFPDPTTIPLLLARVASETDADAWRAFVERYRPFVNGQCRRAGLQPADADEICSRVLASLAVAMSGFVYDPARRFRGYLNVVVRNAIHAYWRELARHPGSVGSGIPDLLDGLEWVEMPSMIADLAEELDERVSADVSALQLATARITSRVSADTWQAFWRTGFECAPAAVVARELGKSVAAVHMAKNRVIRMLRAEVDALPDTA